MYASFLIVDCFVANAPRNDGNCLFLKRKTELLSKTQVNYSKHRSQLAKEGNLGIRNTGKQIKSTR